MKKLSILMLLLFTCSSYSQVAIHPQGIFLSEKKRSSQMEIFNTSDKPKEVIIDLVYGYPAFDSLGVVYMKYDSTNTTSSAVENIKYFPKKLIIQPKGKQTVRFIASSLGELKDGTYWTRVIVTSMDITKQIDSSFDENSVNVRLDIRIRMSAALILTKGKTNTSLAVNGHRIRMDSANMNLIVDFDRQGNSPCWGVATIKIYNEQNDLVAEKFVALPVYYSSCKAFSFDKTQFSDGKYRAELIINNKHEKIPENFRSNFPELTETLYFDIINKM